jgi:hypothetical protein
LADNRFAHTVSEPLPTQPGHAPGAPGDADREARIEQLLLSGLDHYFAGEYERAIGVWTRVIFLERQHDRARAYIERARSALAERQREIDELVHTGVAAYNSGEMGTARDLLTRAADMGSDTAHVFLDRLNRVGTADDAAAPRPVAAPLRASTVLPRVAAEPRRFRWLAAGAAAAVVGAVMLVGGLPLGTWLSDLHGADPAPVPTATVSEPLPVVRASETALDRAQALREDGRLRDALLTLDTIDRADPFRGDADRLRGQIQRELLAAAGIATGPPGEATISR